MIRNLAGASRDPVRSLDFEFAIIWQSPSLRAEVYVHNFIPNVKHNGPVLVEGKRLTSIPVGLGFEDSTMQYHELDSTSASYGIDFVTDSIQSNALTPRRIGKQIVLRGNGVSGPKYSIFDLSYGDEQYQQQLGAALRTGWYHQGPCLETAWCACHIHDAEWDFKLILPPRPDPPTPHTWTRGGRKSVAAEAVRIETTEIRLQAYKYAHDKLAAFMEEFIKARMREGKCDNDILYIWRSATWTRYGLWQIPQNWQLLRKELY
jgi:hypothetical protein